MNMKIDVLVTYRFKGEKEKKEEVMQIKKDETYTFSKAIQMVESELNKKYSWKTEDIVDFSISFKN